jgi:pyruvoyl-dependent arginine decarboxylase (PvlArgDC)
MDTESLLTPGELTVDEVTVLTGLVVGDSVETIASMIDGAGEGLLVTCAVGAVEDVAASDGSLEKTTDGTMDGTSDDSMDGKADGVNVGWIVGVTVGRAVGRCEGEEVAASIICAIGSSSFFSSRFGVSLWWNCVPFNVARAIVAFVASSSEGRRYLMVADIAFN